MTKKNLDFYLICSLYCCLVKVLSPKRRLIICHARASCYKPVACTKISVSNPDNYLLSKNLEVVLGRGWHLFCACFKVMKKTHTLHLVSNDEQKVFPYFLQMAI